MYCSYYLYFIFKIVSVDSVSTPKKLVDKTLYLINDVLDRTQAPFIPLFSDVKLQPNSDTYLSKNEFAAKLGLNSGTLVAWNGPCLPTESESYVAFLIGASFISIFSPSIFLNALNLNWNVTVIAGLSNDLSIPIYLNELELNCLFDNLYNSCNSFKLDSLSHAADKFVSMPLNQENSHFVNSFASALTNHFNELPNAAIFVDYCSKSILSNYEISKSIRGYELDGWVDSNVGGPEKLSSRWILSIGTNKVTNKKALLIHSDFSPEFEIPNLYLLQFIVRGLKVAKFIKLIFTGMLSSCSSDLSAGRLALISDHVNISGWNPLCGHNNEEWGTRFPDMSNTYSKSLNSIIRNTAIAENVDIVDVTTAHYCEIIQSSTLANNFTKLVTCKSMCSGIIPNIIVANHMRFESVCIAFINSDLNNKKVYFSDKVANDFDKLVNSII